MAANLPSTCPRVCAACVCYVATQLSACGLPPQLWGARLKGIDLDEDLCELLWAEMNLGGGSPADQAEENAELTTLFERWSARNAAALTLHLASLHRTTLKALHTCVKTKQHATWSLTILPTQGGSHVCSNF